MDEYFICSVIYKIYQLVEGEKDFKNSYIAPIKNVIKDLVLSEKLEVKNSRSSEEALE